MGDLYSERNILLKSAYPIIEGRFSKDNRYLAVYGRGELE